MSIYDIVFPEKPSDLIIAVVGWKVINVGFDIAFFVEQRKILKTHSSAISEANYAGALAALLFDSVTLVSLLIIWLLRDNPIGVYISPTISIFIAIFLTVGCIRRTKTALDDLTDKTLPEEMQMKILNILTRFYHRFSQLHSINSHKYGNFIKIDLHLSFENNTRFEDIMDLKKQMQKEFDSQFGSCIVNIVVGE
jgi:divalent metal cation (Fe/Co/Zn/Cd) transporter